MRKLILCVGLLAGGPISVVYALGLGEIELHSVLNQQLDAEVQLFAVDDVSVRDINVSLAPYEAFERAGLDRPDILSQLVFAVEKKADGTPWIKIQSRQPIKEPFLDFLLQVDWPTGRLIREYTLLLDPPLFAPQESTTLEAPITATRDEGTATRPLASAPTPVGPQGQPPPAARATEPAVSAHPPPTTTRTPMTPSQRGSSTSGTVQRGDTLWAIAERMRPDKSVSVQQVMLALLKLNPEAFFNNNINQLKAGYVLRVPDQALIESFGEAEAAREADRQYRSWLASKQGRRVVPLDARKAVTGGKHVETTPSAEPAGTPAPAGAGGARLKLVVPDVEGSNGEGGGLSGERSPEQIEQELILALEAADANRQESEELRERVKMLEEQIAKLERLVNLKDDTLAALQQQLGTEVPLDQGGTALAQDAGANSSTAIQAPTAGPDVADAGPTEGADDVAGPPIAEVDETPSALPLEQATGSTPETTESASPPVIEDEIEQDTPEPWYRAWLERVMGVVRPVIEEPRLLGIGLGGVLVVAALAWLVMRRRSSRVAEYDEAVIGNAAPVAAAAAAATMEATSEPGEISMDSFGEMVDDSGESLPLVAEAATSVVQDDITEGDPLAEAEIFLAYQRYSQAEELIKEAIGHEPDRHELKLKLLEVYAASEDKDAFINQATELYAALGGAPGPLWSQAVEMGKKLCPENVLFSEPEAEPVTEDLDLGADLSSAGGSADSLGDEFDLSLPNMDQFEESALSETSVDSTEATSISAEGGLEYDLDRAGFGTDDQSSSGGEGDFGAGLEFTSDAGEKHTQSADDANALELSLDDDTDTTAYSLELGGSEESRGARDDAQGEIDKVSGGQGEEVDDLLGAIVEQDLDNVSLPFNGAGLDASQGDANDDAAAYKASDKIGVDADLVTSDEMSFDFDLVSDGDSSDDLSELGLEPSREEPPTPTETGSELSLEGLPEDLVAGETADLSVSSGDMIDEEFLSDDAEPLSDADVTGTKLDLAKAYIDMGDHEGARSILDEVLEEGDEVQQRDAKELIAQLG